MKMSRAERHERKVKAYLEMWNALSPEQKRKREENRQRHLLQKRILEAEYRIAVWREQLAESEPRDRDED